MMSWFSSITVDKQHKKYCFNEIFTWTSLHVMRMTRIKTQKTSEFDIHSNICCSFALMIAMRKWKQSDDHLKLQNMFTDNSCSQSPSDHDDPWLLWCGRDHTMWLGWIKLRLQNTWGGRTLGLLLRLCLLVPVECETLQQVPADCRSCRVAGGVRQLS